jgi:hypothetical protein
MSYLEIYYQSSYKNSKALNKITQNMDESSSDVNIAPRTMVFQLAFYMVVGVTVRMSMLMKGGTHPA